MKKFLLSVVKLTKNILTNKTKDMRNLSVRLVYGRRSLGIAPNVIGLGEGGLVGCSKLAECVCPLLPKPVLQAGAD